MYLSCFVKRLFVILTLGVIPLLSLHMKTAAKPKSRKLTLSVCFFAESAQIYGICRFVFAEDIFGCKYLHPAVNAKHSINLVKLMANSRVLALIVQVKP